MDKKKKGIFVVILAAVGVVVAFVRLRRKR